LLLFFVAYFKPEESVSDVDEEPVEDGDEEPVSDDDEGPVKDEKYWENWLKWFDKIEPLVQSGHTYREAFEELGYKSSYEFYNKERKVAERLGKVKRLSRGKWTRNCTGLY